MYNFPNNPFNIIQKMENCIFRMSITIKCNRYNSQLNYCN